MLGRISTQGVGPLLEPGPDTTDGSSRRGNVHIRSNTHLNIKDLPKQVTETPHIHIKP